MPKPRVRKKNVTPYNKRTNKEKLTVRRVLDRKIDAKNLTYDPYVHPQGIIDFFRERYSQIRDPERYETDKGQIGWVIKPVRPPTQAAYAALIGVRPNRLWEWGKRYQEFHEALGICKAMQAAMLIELGTTGALNPAVTNFTLKNLQEWTDRVEETHKGSVALQFDAQDDDA